MMKVCNRVALKKLTSPKSNCLFLDDVRAPIPQREEVLIQPGYEGYSINRTNKFRQSRVRTVFDGFRNFSNETSKFTEIQKIFRKNLNFHEFFYFFIQKAMEHHQPKERKEP